MINFKCLDCKKNVQVFVDEACVCGSTKIKKYEYETNKNWLKWWRDKGSKDRNKFYKSLK